LTGVHRAEEAFFQTYEDTRSVTEIDRLGFPHSFQFFFFFFFRWGDKRLTGRMGQQTHESQTLAIWVRV
jgi:hypothetical protein